MNVDMGDNVCVDGDTDTEPSKDRKGLFAFDMVDSRVRILLAPSEGSVNC